MPMPATTARTMGNLGLIESMSSPGNAMSDLIRATGYQTVMFKWQYSVSGYSAVPITVVAFRAD
jgi:hypothetical protein